MSTSADMPSVAADLPADEGIITSQGIEIEELRGRLAVAEGESLEKDEEIARTREELRKVNLELRESAARLEGVTASLNKLKETKKLQRIADELNWLMASNKNSFIVVYESFRTVISTYFLVKEKDGQPVLHFLDNSGYFMPPQALVNLDTTKFRLARTGEDITFEEQSNVDDKT